jgi:hypothetical protein
MRLVRRTVVVVIGMSAACASCSATASDRSAATTTVEVSASVTATTAAPSVSTSTSTSADSGECDQTPILTSELPEVQGIGRDATIYGLVFLTHPGQVRAGEELKIVWRMTGQGDLSVSYFAPDGRPGVLTFGPEAHGGSTYQRPGDEWGTGFSFDAAGCWRIHLERSVGSGDVWLAVAP